VMVVGWLVGVSGGAALVVAFVVLMVFGLVGAYLAGALVIGGYYVVSVSGLAGDVESDFSWTAEGARLSGYGPAGRFSEVSPIAPEAGARLRGLEDVMAGGLREKRTSGAESGRQVAGKGGPRLTGRPDKGVKGIQ
jgi:hypothetical protein